MRLPRDRAGRISLVLLGLGLLGVLGVGSALLLTRGQEEAAPPSTATPPPTTTAPPPTTTALPPPTTAPPPTTTAPPPTGPIAAVATGPFAATIAVPPGVDRVAYGLPDLGPTQVAPVTGGQAKLTGLRHATPYRVWAAGTTFDLTTAGPPASPIAAVGGGTILLDGEPFFPFLVLAQCPDGYEASLAAGVSLFAENPCGGVTAQTAALGGRALAATGWAEAGTGGQGVIGWFYPDEPDLHGMTGPALPQLPDPAATGRLRFLTLGYHFYSRSPPPTVGRDAYPGLIARADVVGFDLYPLQELCDPAWLPAVYESQRELVRLAPGKPTFQWIEATSWKCRTAGLLVTPATIRAESWLAVAGGARGLGFFPGGWSGEIGAAIGGVTRELAALGAAVVAPEQSVTADGGIVASGRALNGAQYVFAVNPTRRAVRATIRMGGLGDRRLQVVGEGRQVQARGGALVDAWAGLAVHLYVALP